MDTYTGDLWASQPERYCPSRLRVPRFDYEDRNLCIVTCCEQVYPWAPPHVKEEVGYSLVERPLRWLVQAVLMIWQRAGPFVGFNIVCIWEVNGPKHNRSVQAPLSPKLIDWGSGVWSLTSDSDKAGWSCCLSELELLAGGSAGKSCLSELELLAGGSPGKSEVLWRLANVSRILMWRRDSSCVHVPEQLRPSRTAPKIWLETSVVRIWLGTLNPRGTPYQM